MRFTVFAATIAILLIADQVRTGGYYRHEVLSAVGQNLPKSAERVLAFLY
jgi:hypothetical protein